MAQDWFSQGTAPAPSSAPAASKRRGGFLADPYKPREEARKEEDQGMERTRLGLAQSAEARQRAADDRAARAEATRLELERQRLNQQGGQNGQQQGNTRFDNVSKLRTEFTGRQEVKDFQTVLPQIASAMKLASDPKATGADDLSLIYTFGKVMDPGSVVREGELALASGTGSFAQNMQAAAEKLRSGEKLPAGVRHNLVEAMRRRGVAMSQAYNQSRGQYEALATRNGFNPIDVVGSHPAAPFHKAEQQYLGIDPNGGDVSASMATGATQNIIDKDKAPAVSALQAMLRSGSPDAEIMGAATALNASPDSVASALEFRRKHPNYKGTYDLSGLQLTQQRTAARTTPGLAAGLSFVDAATAGVPNLLSGGKMDMVRAAQPGASTLGTIAGSLVGAGASEVAATAGLAKAGMSAARALTWGGRAGDAGYGATIGATGNPDDPLLGAGLGATAALVGRGIGEKVLAPAAGYIARTEPVANGLNRVRGTFGRQPMAAVEAPTPARQAIGAALTRSDPAAVRTQLAEASSLGLPFTAADTHPELRELAAASVRRSPLASETAEQTLLPRARGQIDRFGQAVERDLGPVANVPQLSDDMMREARTAAAPLYDAAYSRPGASSVHLDDIIDRPLSMRPGMARARSIAAEEGRDPSSLGFDFDAEGNTIFTQTPSFQTLDYVKRGLDDVLEPHRDPLSGRLRLNEATRAINATKNDLLGRIDAVNPEYAAARGAYAGPVSARDALARGMEASSLSPDELGFQVAQQSPEHLAQMQLGHRSAMINRANSVRDVSNPFEATLSTPAAQQRLSVLYPDNPNVERLLHVRELERRMAETTNAVLGNSKTAQRGLADEAFAAPNVIGTMAGAGVNLATGGGAGDIAKVAITRALQNVGGRLGLQQSVAKADEIAPLLLNSDPITSSAAMDEIVKALADYRAYQTATTPTRSLGSVGAGFGSALTRQ